MDLDKDISLTLKHLYHLVPNLTKTTNLLDKQLVIKRKRLGELSIKRPATQRVLTGGREFNDRQGRDLSDFELFKHCY